MNFNTNEPPKLSEALYQARKRSGMTQDELAEALGVTHQSVSKWENGECCPDAQKLIAIAGIYGISLDRLCGGDPPEPGTYPTAKKRPSRKLSLLCGITALLLISAAAIGGFFAGRTSAPQESGFPEEITVTSVRLTPSGDSFLCSFVPEQYDENLNYSLLFYRAPGEDGTTAEPTPVPVTMENGVCSAYCTIQNLRDDFDAVVLQVSDGSNTRECTLASDFYVKLHGSEIKFKQS